MFEKEQVKKAVRLTHFMDFINKISPFYDDIPLDVLGLFPWNDDQETLGHYIENGLKNLADDFGQPPSTIIKGVYFCLADDARHFSIHGSLYYNEADWAANTYYNYNIDIELFSNLSDELTLLQLDSEVIQDLLYLFSAFTLLKTLNTIDNIPYIANTTMALGYCDGDELILGYFLNQNFIEHIEIIENGEYENPSAAPVIVREPLAPRGDLWMYMFYNCMSFMETHELTGRFYKFGEEEAERICDTFKNQLTLNHCPLCDAIRKTPRARLCLKCGEFTPPVEC